MNKNIVISLLESFVWLLGTKYKSDVKSLIKQLKSPEVDIIVWNDISVPITENGAYLFSDGKTTTFVSQFIIKREPNEMIHWLNKHRDTPIIKWAKAPEYKTD